MDAVKKSFDIPKFKEQYENYIGGEWVAPKGGEYFDCTSPVDGLKTSRKRPLVPLTALPPMK